MLPSAKGFGRDRESFTAKTAMVFDPLSSAEALSNFVLTLILHPDRLARVNQQTISLNDYLEAIRTRLFNAQRYEDGYTNQLAMIPQKVFVIHLI